jgi:hypothetical protein
MSVSPAKTTSPGHRGPAPASLKPDFRISCSRRSDTTPDEPDSQARIAALAQGLEGASWAVGRNVRIDVRWSSGDLARLRGLAQPWAGSLVRILDASKDIISSSGARAESTTGRA